MDSLDALQRDPTAMRIHRLGPRHAAAYRDFMLRAYAEAPQAFTATVSERAALPMAWWMARVAEQPDAPERVFGAFVDAGLTGVAGLRLAQRPRIRHKATLFGLAVLPASRGRGVGRALVEAVLAQARDAPGVQVVQLTVAATNARALRLYSACGFRAFGTEPMALRMDDGFVPLVHMWHALEGKATLPHTTEA